MSGRPRRKLEPNPETALVVQEIFRLYLSGVGDQRIAAQLNERGIKAAAGGEWTRQSIKSLLGNRAYAGTLVYGRSHFGKGIDPIVAKGLHEPLVDEDTFKRAVQLRQNRQPLAPRQSASFYPFTGIARCGLCGSSKQNNG